MLKRALFFSTPVNLSMRDAQLVFWLKEAPDEKRTVPIEDIGFVVLENRMISITMPLLTALSEKNVAVIVCNERGMPCSMLMNLDSNSTQGESFRAQIEASEPLKKNLWKQTVEAKIANQARLLDSLGLDGRALKPLHDNVRSGDSDNREGVAAKLYWNMLMGREFVREREGPPPNSLFNYGYSILRAAVARSLMGSGLLPALGIFHRNRYNAFPLADDIMEPFRPMVDRIVHGLSLNGQTELTKEVKAALLQILFIDTVFDKVTRPLEVGLSMTTSSLARCFAGKCKRISYPLLE
ncbi:CRISPR-associated endonuclease Cas1 [Bacteroidia bacterium]|nr:CRISPR-associated endonuclease Cas1 [Bacteroidia bacterium]